MKANTPPKAEKYSVIIEMIVPGTAAAVAGEGALEMISSDHRVLQKEAELVFVQIPSLQRHASPVLTANVVLSGYQRRDSRNLRRRGQVSLGGPAWLRRADEAAAGEAESIPRSRHSQGAAGGRPDQLVPDASCPDNHSGNPGIVSKKSGRGISPG